MERELAKTFAQKLYAQVDALSARQPLHPRCTPSLPPAAPRCTPMHPYTPTPQVDALQINYIQLPMTFQDAILESIATKQNITQSRRYKDNMQAQPQEAL